MDRHPGGPTTIVAWAGKVGVRLGTQLKMLKRFETLVLDGHQDASKFFNDIHKGVKIDSYLRPEVVAQLVDGFY